jgi:hypothetical protein
MRIQPNMHPSLQQLADFDRGRLPAAEWTEIARHIEECENCCRALEDVPADRLIVLIRAALNGLDRFGETGCAYR